MKYQSTMIRIILGLVFICFFITPGSCLDLGVTVLSEEVQISDTDPSGNFSMEIDASQTLTITLDRNCTVVWYIDNTTMRTDTNTTTSTYYFTESTEGNYNVTVISRDSLTNASQVDFTWFITIESIPYEKKGEGTPYTPSYITPEEPVEPEEPKDGLIDLLPKYKWSLPSDFDLIESADKSMIGLLAAFSLLFIYTVKKGEPSKAGVGSKKKLVVAAGKDKSKKTSKKPHADPNRKEPSKTSVKSKEPENKLAKSQEKHEPTKDSNKSKKSVKPKKSTNKLSKSQNPHEPSDAPVKSKKSTNKLTKSQNPHEPSDAPIKPKEPENKLAKSQEKHEPTKDSNKSKKSVKPKKPENKLTKSQDKHEPTKGPVEPKKSTNKLSKSQDRHEPSDAPVKPKKSTNKLTKSQNPHEPSETPSKAPVKKGENDSIKDMSKHIPKPKER